MAQPVYQYYAPVDDRTILVDKVGPYATFWRRFGAFIIDLIIYHSLIALTVFIAARIFAYHGANIDWIVKFLAQRERALLMLYAIGWPAYNAFFESSNIMASPGKRIRGLMVTDTFGYQLLYHRAFLRNVVAILSVAAAGLGLLPMRYSKKRQALHDLITASVVLNRSYLGL